MEIDVTQIIIAAVGLLFTAVIIPLVKAAFEWLKGKTKNEALKAAIGEAQIVVETVVDSLNQTVVEGLKEKSKDGKLTKEDAADVLELAVEMVKSDLSSTALAWLTAKSDDIEAFIRNMIEAKIAQSKMNCGTLITNISTSEG